MVRAIDAAGLLVAFAAAASCAATPVTAPSRTNANAAPAATIANAPGDTASAPHARASLLLSDPFDGVPGTDLTTELQAAPSTQLGALAPAAYVRIPGVWFDAPPAPVERVARVDEVPGFSGGALCFNDHSAVRLEAPIEVPPGYGVSVSAVVDPSVGEHASLSWISFILTADPRSRGWVTDRDAVPGLLIRSNGAIQLFALGSEAHEQWDNGPVATPVDVHRIGFRVIPDRSAQVLGVVVRGELDGHRFHAALPATPSAVPAIPPVVHLEIGAHFHPEGRGPSCIDQLRVMLVPPREQ
jgi:hypothetical protein